MAKSLIFLLIFSACFSASAIEVEYDYTYMLQSPCAESSAISQAECTSKKLGASDKKLNLVYRQLLKKLPEESRDAASKSDLISAQRAWLKYRDLDCHFRSATTGANSTWQAVHGMSCAIKFNEERIKTLKGLDPL